MNRYVNELHQFQVDPRSSRHSRPSIVPLTVITSLQYIPHHSPRTKPTPLSFSPFSSTTHQMFINQSTLIKRHPSNHLLIHNHLSSPELHSIPSTITIQSFPTLQPNRKTQLSLLINSNPIRPFLLTTIPHSINTLHSPSNSQSRMQQPLSPEIDELREYKFIQFIRKRKRRRVMKRFLEGYCLFVPINISLTNRVTSKDIRQIVNLLLTL